MPDDVRVLVVDDSKPIRQFVRQILKQLSVQVVGEAANGLEAVSAYKLLKPDLVLLDVNMPLMDGKAALHEILKEDPKARVVMLTSVNWSEAVVQCIEAGALHYLLKDMSKEEVVRELQAIVGLIVRE